MTAGGEETDSGGQFRVPRRGSVRRREDGERGTSKRTGRSERVESSWRGDGGPADLKETEHLCDTGMPVRNGNIGNDRTTTTKTASVRKQLGTKNSRSKDGRQEKNVGVKGRDRSAEELDRETGAKQTTMGRPRWKDGGWQSTEESGRVSWAGQGETREAKAEMGGLSDARKAGEEEDWKKKTRDRRGWKRLSDEAVKKLRAAPHPWQRDRER